MGFFSLSGKKKQHLRDDLIRPFVEKCIFTEQDNNGYTIFTQGWALVSDPETDMGLWVGAKDGNGSWWSPFASGALCKSGARAAYAEAPFTGLSYCRIGATDNFFNVNHRGEVEFGRLKSQTRWMLTDRGLPMAAVRYHQHRMYGTHTMFDAEAFSHDEIVFIPSYAENTENIRINMHLAMTDLAGAHFESLAHPNGDAHAIVISKANWHCRVVIAAYPATDWYIGAWEDEESAVPYSCTGSPFNGSSPSLGIENRAGAAGNIHTCFALSCQPISMTPEQASDEVISRLLDWEAERSSAMSYWDNFWAGYTNQWDEISPIVRAKGLIAAQQIAANTYKGGQIGGQPYWGAHIAIRDVAWAIRGLAKIAPEFVKSVAQWFVGADPIEGAQGYTWEGNMSISCINTDNAAAWLIAMSELWATSRDTALFTSLVPQMLSALAYVKSNFVEIDKHVYTHHPHDFHDDYSGYGSVIHDQTHLIKYESYIDTLWIAALEGIAPALVAVGDGVNAAWCRSTAAALRVGLEDFREIDGGLNFGAKTTGGLWSEIDWICGTVSAADLLDDTAASRSLLSPQRARTLGLNRLPAFAPVDLMNWRNLTTAAKRDRVWAGSVLQVAGQMARLGRYDLLHYIEDAFPIGGWPETIVFNDTILEKVPSPDYYVSKFQASDFRSTNFMWSNGDMISLCNTLASIR